MNIFINISHPAHVHFFKNAIRVLSERGHGIIAGARNKEFTIELLKAYGIRYVILTNKGKGIFGLIKELLAQQVKIAGIIRKNPIDIMLQIGGIFNAPVGKCCGIPTLTFSDTENDKWGNKISFALSKYVFSPDCYDHSAGDLWKNQIHYPGYHELAYLSPRYVPEKITPQNRILVRFVGWGAGHDIGEEGLSDDKKIEVVNELAKHGRVHISSESPLPGVLSEFDTRFHPSEIHDFMKTCKMIVGESATMASEAACLGIPAVFVSNTGRGYTTEQDKKYGLIKHYRVDQWDAIIRRIKVWASQDLNDQWQKRRWRMLKDKMDVTPWLVDLVEDYPNSLIDARKGLYGGYKITCAD
jgi:predicted glycosyltransferase